MSKEELCVDVELTDEPMETKEELNKEVPSRIIDLPGVGAATAEKLEGAGYHDLMAIAVDRKSVV